MPRKKKDENVTQETAVEEKAIDSTAEDVDSANSEEETPIAENEILGIDEILQRDVSRENARLETMSKKKKKEIYASEHVYTEYGVTDIETESTKKKAEYTELVASQKSNKILRGEVTGWHYADPDNQASTILAEIKFQNGYWDILIPSYLLFDYELDEKYASVEANMDIEKIVTKRIGSTIDFVVQTITNEGKVFADRLLAMSLKGVSHYVSKGMKDARIQAGYLVEGTVTMVSRTFVMIEALGAEMKIPQKELSWFHIGDAREEFKVGDKVIARIMSAKEFKTKKYSNSYTLIDAEASIRLAEKDPRPKHYNSFRVGGRYSATVTYVEDNVFVNLAGKMDAMVAYPRFGDVPARGDKKIVEVTGKDDEKMFIYGVFVNN